MILLLLLLMPAKPGVHYYIIIISFYILFYYFCFSCLPSQVCINFFDIILNIISLFMLLVPAKLGADESESDPKSSTHLPLMTYTYTWSP